MSVLLSLTIMKKKDFLEYQPTSSTFEDENLKTMWTTRNIFVGCLIGSTLLAFVGFFCISLTGNDIKASSPIMPRNSTNPDDIKPAPADPVKKPVIPEIPYEPPEGLEILTPRPASNGKIFFVREFYYPSGFLTNSRHEYLPYTVDPDGTNLFKIPISGYESNPVAISFSNDGTKMMFLKHQGDKLAINTINMDGTDEKLLYHPDTITHLGYPSFSPNDKEIVYISYDEHHNRYIKILNIETQKISLFKTECDAYPTFSPDGQHILCLQDEYIPWPRGYLHSYSVKTGRFEKTIIQETSNLDSFSISPDGKRIAYIDFKGLSIINLNSDGKEKSKTLLDSDLIHKVRWSPDGRSILFIRRQYIEGSGFKYDRYLSKIDLSGVPDGEKYKIEDIKIEDKEYEDKSIKIDTRYLSWQSIPLKTA